MDGITLDEARDLFEELLADAISDLKEDLHEEFVTRSNVIEIIDDEGLIDTEGFNDAFEDRLADVSLEI